MVGATRPRSAYSLTDTTPARTIWVYRNGDPYYLGRKFVINHRYVPNFEAFMIQLNEGVPTPFGVRNLYTPRQGHSVTDLPGLQQGGRYVVAGRERFKKLNYFNIGARKPQRRKEEVIRPVVHSNIQVPSKWQSIYNKPRNITVFTNGDMLISPVKILIPKFTLRSWNGVLGLINEKVFPRSGGIHRLYTLNGRCVHGPDELEDNQFYVGCGKEKFKHLPYWQHPKVPQYIRRNFSNSPGPPEKIPPKRAPIELSKPEGSIHRPRIQPPKQGEGDRASVYYAKPKKASRETAPRLLSPDHGPSVYKARQSPKEIQGAQEIQEAKDIQVEVPLDQVPAEVVPEEDIYSNAGAIEEQSEEEDKEGYYEEEEIKEAAIDVEGEEIPEEKTEKKGIFKKMFGFFFNKPKKKGKQKIAVGVDGPLAMTESNPCSVNNAIPPLAEVPQTSSARIDDRKEDDTDEQDAKKQTTPYSATNEQYDYD